MIPVTFLMARVPQANGAFFEHRNHARTFLDSARVDTVTEVLPGQHKEHGLPEATRSIVRYVDSVTGYRLLFVAETADAVARLVFRDEHGEDPTQPDYAIIGGGGA